MGLDILTRTPELLVMDQSYDADAQGPPPHHHPAQDEHFEVLEGAIAAQIAGEDHVFGLGEAFDIPRGTVHTMGPHGGAPARVRWEVRPALRTEAFLTGLAESASLDERLEHVRRYSEEFRLAGT